MQFLQVLSIVFCAVICVLLILLILMQSGKGNSMAILGGASSVTPFGASTLDIVTKLTWWLVAAFFTLSILSAIAFAEGAPDLSTESEAVEELPPEESNAQSKEGQADSKEGETKKGAAEQKQQGKVPEK